jgi:hypothetical protein
VVIDAPAHIHPAIFDQIKPSLDRLDCDDAVWEHYLGFVKRMPYFNEWWDPAKRSVLPVRTSVRTRTAHVRPRSRAEHIRAVIDGFKDLNWLDYGAADHATGALLESAGRVRPARIAADRVSRASACQPSTCCRTARLLDIPGNHMTMLFGAGAPIVTAEITRFVLGPASRDAVGAD